MYVDSIFFYFLLFDSPLHTFSSSMAATPSSILHPSASLLFTSILSSQFSLFSLFLFFRFSFSGETLILLVQSNICMRFSVLVVPSNTVSQKHIIRRCSFNVASFLHFACVSSIFEVFVPYARCIPCEETIMKHTKTCFLVMFCFPIQGALHAFQGFGTCSLREVYSMRGNNHETHKDMFW